MRRLQINGYLSALLGCIFAMPALAQLPPRSDDSWSQPRAASLGLPQADSGIRQAGLWESTGSANRDRDSGRIDSTSRRYDELPPPDPRGGELPIPSSLTKRKGNNFEVARPFTIDYVFLARSPVDGPDNAITMNEIGINYQFRFPVGEQLLVTMRPLFDVTFLSGPDGPSPTLPAQLYKLAIDMQADVRVTECIGISFGITPGFWSDFKKFGTEDIRIPVRLLGTYKVSDDLYLAAGINYTDNLYRNLLPAGGILWNASEQVRLELLWPRSRIVYKLRDNLQFYGVFEYAGDTYHINEATGDEDMQYRDYRLMVGSQVDLFERASIFGEVGIAYDRVFRFDIQPTTGVGNSLVVRAGIRF